VSDRQLNSIRRKPRGLRTERRLVELAKHPGTNELPELMDLVHITSAGRGRRIITAEKIETRRCNVFDRELVYAFVARPAYRFPDGNEKSEQINRFPVVFVISPRNLEEPHHIYPMDTGAAVKGVYGSAVDPEVYLEEYELDPDLNATLLHIAWAFGSKAAYFDGHLKTGLANTLPHWESAVRGWIKIATLPAEGSNRPDDRASAIEIAYRSNIALRDNVRLIILPQQLLEDPRGSNTQLIAALKSLKLEIKCYDWRPNETPDSFMADITTIVRRHLEDTGQL